MSSAIGVQNAGTKLAYHKEDVLCDKQFFLFLLYTRDTTVGLRCKVVTLISVTGAIYFMTYFCLFSLNIVSRMSYVLVN